MQGLSKCSSRSGGISDMPSGLIDKKSRSHHEQLWKAWYTGIQTITVPAAAAAAFSTTSLNRTASMGSPSSSRHLASTVYATDTNERVLGDVVHHTFDSASIEAIDSEEQNDESFDSLTLTLTLATAPKQDVSESQL